MNVLTLPWLLFAVTCVAELGLMHWRLPAKQRLISGSVLLLVVSVALGMLVIDQPVEVALPLLFIGCYRVVNVMRYVYGRMHEDYLYRVVPRSSAVLIAAQVAGAGSGLFLTQHHVTASVVLLLFSVLHFAVAALLLSSFIVSEHHSQLVEPAPLPQKRLPTVSVLIPARNETADLEACLKSVVASTYQKLEILVLDDSSQDKTPDIIRAFAHDGVRFVKGSEPGDVWLPKNAAYNKLAKEASGTYLLFCGVDVRFEPEDISVLVRTMMEQQLTMVSVLPQRDASAPTNSAVQQIRYIWELALPRSLAHRPPVLSTMWMIERTALTKYGGMAAVRRNVVPEGYFARELDKTGLYRFVRAGEHLGVRSMKAAAEQRHTALRVRYPQLHRRPEMVLAVTVFELALVLSVLPLLIYSVLSQQWMLLGGPAAALVAYVVLFVRLARIMGRGSSGTFLLQSILFVPLDLWLMHQSMYRYEFGIVHWKERNVSLPVMHVIPSLPKLPEE